METQSNNWVRDNDRVYEIYTKYKYFNNCKYLITVFVDSTRCTKFSFGVSSGKKRKHLEIFEEKESKSFGGITALLWIKEMIYEFPIWYNNNYVVKGKQYIIIAWADSKRRNVYSRLLREGFIYMKEGGRKVLMKEIKL